MIWLHFKEDEGHGGWGFRGYWYQLPSPVDMVEGKKRLLQVVFLPPHTGHGMQQKAKEKKKKDKKVLITETLILTYPGKVHFLGEKEETRLSGSESQISSKLPVRQ